MFDGKPNNPCQGPVGTNTPMNPLQSGRIPPQDWGDLFPSSGGDPAIRLRRTWRIEDHFEDKTFYFSFWENLTHMRHMTHIRRICVIWRICATYASYDASFLKNTCSFHTFKNWFRNVVPGRKQNQKCDPICPQKRITFQSCLKVQVGIPWGGPKSHFHRLNEHSSDRSGLK